jgi:hypothetical protein
LTPRHPDSRPSLLYVESGQEATSLLDTDMSWRQEEPPTTRSPPRFLNALTAPVCATAAEVRVIWLAWARRPTGSRPRSYTRRVGRRMALRSILRAVPRREAS